MKTHNHLWPAVVSFENLLLAARKAQKGKRFKENTAQFNLELEKELLQLQKELIDRTYQPGRYKVFIVQEPVRRMISAAPYRDRVVHHALCNIIEPLFERGFIHDTYANRKYKGTHKAVDRFQSYLRKYRFVLKCDIRKYFPSIDHDILYTAITRRIADPDVLRLVRTIIENSNSQEPVFDHYDGDDLFSPLERRRGLPIGNLTSQFFANIYLNGFDHFIKDELGCKAYLRYVDDFAVFDDNKKHLWEIKALMDRYLAGLRLRLHPIKTRVFTAKNGCEFLGFQVYPELRRVKQENVDRFKSRMKRLRNCYASGEVAVEDINRSVRGWIGHVCHANSFRLRERLFSRMVFTKQSRGNGPKQATVCFAAAPGTIMRRTRARRTGTGTRPTTGTTTTGSVSPSLSTVSSA